ncbi:leucine rich repeats (2 copies) [Kordia sp. SMS9]|uniref:leucine-rich repeat domain-containing protein n=1 Tax=Kordia sp. SMS9 TaxID=2282170 RepID=UPI000E0DD08D|nr:leucine-rich repeat domain-containing protein [Kordia sp. SMS9]AXG68542.1 leucine rich repeats (2 copies) [Kordia sp. SMS9]
MKKFTFAFLFFCFSFTVFSQKPIAVKSIDRAIEETNKGNTVSLSLLDDTSEKFPKAFFKIPKDKLVGLVIDNCNYTAIPKKVSKYQKITYFRYSWFRSTDAPITSLPTFLFKLENLEFLIFESKLIGDISTQIKKLQNLKELSLYGTKLETFPMAVLTLENLKRLKLACNLFEEIPSEISKLKNLELLSFDGGGCGATPITKIPTSIGELSNLRSISFGYAEKGIGYLPSSFFKLKKLEYFGCFGCGLKGFPEEMGNLTNLKRIQMMNLNAFDVFPKSFFTLPNLTSLLFVVSGEEVTDALVKQKELLDYELEYKLDDYRVEIIKF